MEGVTEDSEKEDNTQCFFPPYLGNIINKNLGSNSTLKP